jgi:fermentation-respiration switch protein FrsA (DUF1100 family)
LLPLWILWVLLGAGVAAAATWLVGGSVALAYFSTHPPRRRPKQTPAAFGAAFEDVRFPSADGVMLSGWYVPARKTGQDGNRPPGAVILCHGMMANRAEVLPWAAPLWERGYALLMFDFRALGESGGDLCTAGYSEPQDLRGAVDYLASRPDMADVPIGVFGFSMGGVAAILAAADDPRIQAVATHGAFATLDRALAQRCRHHFWLFGPVVAWATRTVSQKARWFTMSPSAVAPINAISRLTPRPLLLLHGGRDPIVHPADARDLHDAAAHPKHLVILPRSGHKRIHATVRDQAREQLARFFCENLNATRLAAITDGNQRRHRRDDEPVKN